MVKRKRRLSLVAGAVVLVVIATACGNNDNPPGGSASVDQGLTGSITISGSSTVEPISNLVAELFNDPNPDVSITVDGPGTGDGFSLFCKGEIDIADASRAIADDEIAACKDGGIEYQELEVALDGITVMVNSASAIECLTTADLYAIFGPESEGIDSTADANVLSKKVGGEGNIPAQDLEITAPGEESGTYDAFITLAAIEDTALANGIADDKAAALRADYQSSANDNVIIQAMEGSPNAIGFVGFAFAEKAGDQVKEVAIDAGDGCVAPTPDTIADASYPLSRSLYIYPNVATAGQDKAVKAFVDYYLTEDGLVTATEEAGYIPLPADRLGARGGGGGGGGRGWGGGCARGPRPPPRPLRAIGSRPMATFATGDGGKVLASLQGNARRRRKEKAIQAVLVGAAGVSILISAGIVLALLFRALNFLSDVDLGSLWSGIWRPRQRQFDLVSLFLGSFIVTGIAMLVATPLGLGAAIYLSEYARPRARRTLKPVLETLAGIPSVVIGFFALTVLNPVVAQGVFGATNTFTMMAAGIGVGILTIPLIASVAEDAMYAVPTALREAAYGIGARRRTVTSRVVFPAAISGIVAALILGISRALGETMVVAIAAGATGNASRTLDPLEPNQTLTAAIASLAIGSDQVKTTGSGLNAFEVLYLLGLILFAFTLVLNLISERFVRRVRRDY